MTIGGGHLGSRSFLSDLGERGEMRQPHRLVYGVDKGNLGRPSDLLVNPLRGSMNMTKGFTVTVCLVGSMGENGGEGEGGLAANYTSLLESFGWNMELTVWLVVSKLSNVLGHSLRLQASRSLGRMIRGPPHCVVRGVVGLKG